MAYRGLGARHRAQPKKSLMGIFSLITKLDASTHGPQSVFVRKAGTIKKDRQVATSALALIILHHIYNTEVHQREGPGGWRHNLSSFYISMLDLLSG